MKRVSLVALGSFQENAGVQMVFGERSEVRGCIREGKLWGKLKD